MPSGQAMEVQGSLRATSAPVYSASLLTARYSKRPLTVLGRLLDITSKLGAVGLGILLDRARGDLDANMTQRARQLRRALAALGPTFVKLGQALSTRPDLCPPQYLDELALLQDALPTFPNKVAFDCIEEQLGIRLEDVFESLTPEPIAAASLGQVYKGRLKTGEDVAVKVQRPNIEGAIGLDFYLIRRLCAFVDATVDTLTTNVVALLDNFATRVYEELNYVQEARNADRFRQLYGDQSNVVVPGIYWKLTSTKVLVLEWINGTKLSDAAQMAAQDLDVLQLVDIGIQCSLRQLLEYGYFHADPHPGNLLATPDGKLAFLDFGMMSETPQSARLAIIGHVVHLVNRDYEAMARDYYALDFLDPSVDTSPIVPALRGFFDDVLQASVSELNFKTIVDGLGAVLYQYPFNVPPYYALILRSLTVLEGLALYTDPNFKVLAAAYPYMAKRLLTDPHPYLRDSLIELLFKDGTFRWNRLENLLEQGAKSSDYIAGDAMRPLLQLLLEPDGAPLRRLVEGEAVRVMEALLLGPAIDGSLPPPFGLPLVPGVRGLLLPTTASFRESERSALLELRARVLRCWALLRRSSTFDLASLQPIVEVLQQREAQVMGGRIAGGVLQRLAARLLQLALRPPPTTEQQTSLSSGTSSKGGAVDGGGMRPSSNKLAMTARF